MKKKEILHLFLFIVFAGTVLFAVLFFANSSQSYNATLYANENKEIENSQIVATPPSEDPTVPKVVVATHHAIPEMVKALYITKWVTANQKSRERIEGIADRTEVNAVVIDIKDYSGKISFTVTDPALVALGSAENDIPNIRAIINELHAKNIYVIGRISTFQDPYLTEKHPEWAIVKKSDGTVWKDRKGLSFLDPANQHVWDYIVGLAKESYENGFDEINFDYVRYPSDGDIKNIDYKLVTDANGVKTTRADNLETFFKYLSSNLKTSVPNLKTSADLFGLVTSARDDLGIGQVLEKALPYFDYIAPMVYPSHYGDGEYGIAHPASEPYEIITHALADAKIKIEKFKTDLTKPEELRNRVSFSQIRPWIQDFNLGAKYTTDMVKLELKAAYDTGVNSWMIWDPANKYHEDALEKNPEITPQTTIQ